MDLTVLVVAGVISTLLFALSAVPMVWKALSTHDLTSYSVGNLLLANTGNALHSLYVFNLPVGPIWFLHSFYLTVAALMLFLYLKYGSGRSGSLALIETTAQKEN